MQLYVIMQNAINEMHNNGIIAGLTGEAAQLMHDPDPEVRVREKTSLAKSVGKQFIPTTMPVPSNGALSYLAHVNYNSRFVNSITLCFQGGIEGLHTTFASNPNVKLDKYIIQIVTGGDDLDAFKTNIEQLDKMYDDISIVILSNGKTIYDAENNAEEAKISNPTVEEKTQKKGIFAKLFRKKQGNTKSKASDEPCFLLAKLLLVFQIAYTQF